MLLWAWADEQALTVKGAPTSHQDENYTSSPTEPQKKFPTERSILESDTSERDLGSSRIRQQSSPPAKIEQFTNCLFTSTPRTEAKKEGEDKHPLATRARPPTRVPSLLMSPKSHDMMCLARCMTFQREPVS